LVLDKLLDQFEFWNRMTVKNMENGFLLAHHESLEKLTEDFSVDRKGQHCGTLDEVLSPVLLALATDQPLDARYRDHDLSDD
jgi:hypothetical protein